MKPLRFAVWCPGNMRGPIAQPRVRARTVWPRAETLFGAVKGCRSPRELYFALQKVVRTTVYDPGSAKAWRRLVEMEARKLVPETGPILGPVGLDLLFHMPRPQNDYSVGRNAGRLRPSAPRGSHGSGQPKGHKPDEDNLKKPILDGITDAGLWLDDCQVVSGRWGKIWAAQPHQNGVEVLLHPLEDQGKLRLKWLKQQDRKAQKEARAS